MGNATVQGEHGTWERPAKGNGETDLSKYDEGSESELLISSEQGTLWVTAHRADCGKIQERALLLKLNNYCFFLISRKNGFKGFHLVNCYSTFGISTL